MKYRLLPYGYLTNLLTVPCDSSTLFETSDISAGPVLALIRAIIPHQRYWTVTKPIRNVAQVFCLIAEDREGLSTKARSASLAGRLLSVITSSEYGNQRPDQSWGSGSH